MALPELQRMTPRRGAFRKVEGRQLIADLLTGENQQENDPLTGENLSSTRPSNDSARTGLVYARGPVMPAADQRGKAESPNDTHSGISPAQIQLCP